MQADSTVDLAPEKLAVCALVLLAHGSKSATWTTPFESLREQMQALWIKGPVRLAYFEHSQPSLEEVVDALVASTMGMESGMTAGGEHVPPRTRRIHIEPLLLASGFHVQTDLPQRMEALEQKHPGLVLTAGSVLIDATLIQQAILQNCLASIQP